MNKKNVSFDPIKAIVTSSIIAIAGLSMMVGTTKPAIAGSSFSLSISTNDFSVGYRSYSGGGYRYWNPGRYDEHRHWRDGYYSGPVVYNVDRDYQRSDNDGYRNDDHNSYRHDDSRDNNDHGYQQDNHGDYRHDGRNSDSNRGRGGDGRSDGRGNDQSGNYDH